MATASTIECPAVFTARARATATTTSVRQAAKGMLLATRTCRATGATGFFRKRVKAWEKTAEIGEGDSA